MNFHRSANVHLFETMSKLSIIFSFEKMIFPNQLYKMAAVDEKFYACHR